MNCTLAWKLFVLLHCDERDWLRTVMQEEILITICYFWNVNLLCICVKFCCCHFCHFHCGFCLIGQCLSVFVIFIVLTKTRILSSSWSRQKLVSFRLHWQKISVRHYSVKVLFWSEPLNKGVDSIKFGCLFWGSVDDRHQKPSKINPHCHQHCSFTKFVQIPEESGKSWNLK